jgi:hypothetical protein
MLFLILNKEVFDPYVHKDELMIPIMNHFIEEDDYSNYSESYKEPAQANWLDKVFTLYMVFNTTWIIYYFYIGINK